jgi:hypothetical protein
MLFSTTFVSSLAIVASVASAAALTRRDGEYEAIFIGQFAAVAADDFLTFHLVPTTDGDLSLCLHPVAYDELISLSDCKAFCDSIPNCGFANSTYICSTILITF